MDEMLQGKVALVTAAGNGIGRAAALTMARYGARVIVSDIIEEDAVGVAAEILAAGGKAEALRTDVTDEAQVKNLVAFTVERFGRLDCAMNNAGIPNRLNRTSDLERADWTPVMDVGLIGTWLCMKYQLAQMLTQDGGGAIVNTASNAGKHAVVMQAPYGATKAGVISMTQTSAVEYGANRIRVNAVCPGIINTGPIKAFKAQGVDFLKQLQIPMERMGEAEEVAELAAWLVSPRASYVTGQAISVDGGQLACP